MGKRSLPRFNNRTYRFISCWALAKVITMRGQKSKNDMVLESFCLLNFFKHPTCGLAIGQVTRYMQSVISTQHCRWYIAFCHVLAWHLRRWRAPKEGNVQCNLSCPRFMCNVPNSVIWGYKFLLFACIVWYCLVMARLNSGLRRFKIVTLLMQSFVRFRFRWINRGR